MIIRKAKPQDIEKSIEIAKDLGKWFDKRGIKSMKTDFKLDNLVVAIDKGEVLGFLCYATYSGRMQLIWMGVKPGFQRKRIGEKLLGGLEKEAKKYDLHAIEVETLPAKYKYEPYERTRNFYYKNGFKRAYYKKARIKGWDDQIVMEKRLK